MTTSVLPRRYRVSFPRLVIYTNYAYSQCKQLRNFKRHRTDFCRYPTSTCYEATCCKSQISLRDIVVDHIVYVVFILIWLEGMRRNLFCHQANHIIYRSLVEHFDTCKADLWFRSKITLNLLAITLWFWTISAVMNLLRFCNSTAQRVDWWYFARRYGSASANAIQTEYQSKATADRGSKHLPIETCTFLLDWYFIQHC